MRRTPRSPTEARSAAQAFRARRPVPAWILAAGMALMAVLAEARAAAAEGAREIILVDPAWVSEAALSRWAKEGFHGVALLLSEEFEEAQTRAAGRAVLGASKQLYYWIEVGRSPRLAREHPEWMASLGTHEDWRRGFKQVRPLRTNEVAKAWPWVPIAYAPAFQAHLERVRELLARTEPGYHGLFLNHLQGGPSACGCGNLQCRWAVDYGVKATAESTDPAQAASRFMSELKALAPGQQLVPIWTTECDDEDLPAKHRGGDWTTGYSGEVGCAVGRCPKDFTKQWNALVGAHSGPIGLLALHREFQRNLANYGPAAAWVSRCVDYLDRTLPANEGRPFPRESLAIVVQGFGGVPAREEQAARRTARATGAGMVVLARSKLDQSYRPQIVQVR